MRLLAIPASSSIAHYASVFISDPDLSASRATHLDLGLWLDSQHHQSALVADPSEAVHASVRIYFIDWLRALIL